MIKRSKRYKELVTKYKKDAFYSLDDAVKLIKDLATAKYNETINLTVKLSVDPKKAEEQVRTTIVLPQGTGKKVRVLVLASGDKVKEAQDAGAEFVGAEDLVDKIMKGWLDFDAVIATPDAMKFASKLGKILGPRGLMPNPKLGTVTFNIKDAVQKMKAGQVELKTDKFGIVRTIIGKADFGAEKLKDNLSAVIKALIKVKPAHIGTKTLYMKTMALHPTHGPSILMDINGVWMELAG
ncbi:50S ribosomal protein L1 [Candidatus Dependentiae bacterium]|nr:50S ribosomal protein L1 [Candidatus Dependentiae bacterium]